MIKKTIVLLVFSGLSFVTYTVAAEPDSCVSLTELQCIKSTECKLYSVGRDKYACRPARGKCELDFIQWGDAKNSCESKQGCKFIPRNCYCPPDVICRCEGGEPPKCVDVQNNAP